MNSFLFLQVQVSLSASVVDIGTMMSQERPDLQQEQVLNTPDNPCLSQENATEQEIPCQES
jgi:hypothetical protein